MECLASGICASETGTVGNGTHTTIQCHAKMPPIVANISMKSVSGPTIIPG